MDPASLTPIQPDPSAAMPSTSGGMGSAGGLPPFPAPGQPANPSIIPGQQFLNSTTPPPITPSVPAPQANVPVPPLMPNSPGLPPVDMPPTVNVKSELVEKLRVANNVLVTVSNNPSVDQLAAAIGITLVLNKLDKHATAVYSGEAPSTLEFLQPEKTIEKNTDSLRDFIIALDKAKADKLRYKVEDKFVKIFITPYHTSLSENDLEFSQGDFNVDVVLALGVHAREELDQAITAHGRILHDAVTASINNKQPSDLGAINWFQADASSLCEMLVSLVEPLQGDKVLLDDQIATAFLTGVVAETERFSNAKTTPYTMNIAATLMKAGANQQLVSSKLEPPKTIPKEEGLDKAKLDELAKESDAAPTPTASKDGSLAIDHKKDEEEEDKQGGKTLQDLQKENDSSDTEGDSDLAKIHIDEEGKLLPADKASAAQPATPAASASPTNMVLQPPTLGGPMSAIEKPDNGSGQPAVDTPPEDQTALSHGKTVAPLTEEEKSTTLADLEKAVNSKHVDAADQTPSADAAREAIDQAAAAAEPTRLDPVKALGAQPVDLEKSADAPATPDLPANLVGPDQGLPADPTAAPADPSAPPPVPPPMMPPQ